MDLLEYQGKQLFARHEIPVPSGRHATTVDEAVAAADAARDGRVVEEEDGSGHVVFHASSA